MRQPERGDASSDGEQGGSARSPRTFAALGFAQYRRLWGGTFFTFAAGQMTQVARPWLAYELTGSAFWVGVVALAQGIPMFFMSPLGIPCTPPPWGSLTAIDMDSGEIRWQMPFGQIRRFGITVPKFMGWGTAMIGGPITTAGGLIFMAASMDKKFRALDVRTGEELWQATLPYAGMAVPMTYMAGGRQYVVIAAGGNRRTYTTEGDALVAFALGE